MFLKKFQIKGLFRSDIIYLLIILALALAIRAYSITRTLPFIFDSDSGDVFYPSQKMVKQIFKTQEFSLSAIYIPTAKYLPCFKYILFLSLSAVTLAATLYMKIANGLPLSLAASQAFIRLNDNGGLLITARFMVILFGLLTIWLIYFLGREVFNREVGLMAAAFLTVMPQHVTLSQIVWVDSSLLFWTVLLAWFCCKIASDGDLKYYTGAGIAFGGLFATKYSAPFFILFLAHAHALRIHQEKSGWAKMFRDKRLLRFLAMFLVTIIIVYPAFFFPIAKYVNILIRTRNRSVSQSGANLIGEGLKVYWGYIPEFIRTWGARLTLLIFAGAGLILLRKNKSAQIPVIVPLIYFIYMSGSANKVFRWIGPVFPFFALWAAFACYWISQRISDFGKKEWLGKIVMVTTVILLAIKPLSVAIQETVEQSRPDTRIISREWIYKHVPKGTILATYTEHSWAIPPMEKGDFQFESIPYEYYNISDSGMHDAIAKDRPLPLDYYKRKGVQYFVLDNWNKDFHYSPDIMGRFPETARSFQNFYKEMAMNSELVFMVDPNGKYKYNGPKIEVYRLIDKRVS